jgi:predicted dienelactone hydrolase
MSNRIVALYAAGLALLAMVPAVACSSSEGSSLPAITTMDAAVAPGPYAVGVTTLHLVDSTRETEANGDYAGNEGREYDVEVWYPTVGEADAAPQRDAAVDSEGAPYPLVVFAHGLMSSRGQSPYYTEHLASHGYVVVAPDFPLSKGGAPGGASLGAVAEQAGDVSFMIDTFLAHDDEAGNLFESAIDADRIGVTGHSLGGLTTLLSIYGPGRDERIDAALAIEPVACIMTDDVSGDASTPVLVLAGSLDRFVRGMPRIGYDAANPPRYWLEVAGADHVRFSQVDITDEAILATLGGSLGGGQERVSDDATRTAESIGGSVAGCTSALDAEPADDELLEADRQREILLTFATPFFDAYLRENDDSLAFFQDDLAAQVPEARFEMDLGEGG